MKQYIMLLNFTLYCTFCSSVSFTYSIPYSKDTVEYSLGYVQFDHEENITCLIKEIDFVHFRHVYS